MRAAITPLRVSGFRLKQDELAVAPQLLPPLFDAQVLRITEFQRFINGIDNLIWDGQQSGELAQTWMVSLS